MENNKTKDETELIDVSDVAFNEEPTAKSSPRKKTEEVSSGGYLIAPLKERFAAFFIDCAVLYLMYWTLAPIYRQMAFSDPVGPVPITGTHGIIFHSIFLTLAFVYFFITEGVLYASPGKLLCRLSIKNSLGEAPLLKGIFLRNLLRIIDLALIASLVGIILIELTPFHKRLGDFLGDTVVIKRQRSSRDRYVLTVDMLAPASGRIIAGIIDLIIFLAFAFGYFLLLDPDEPLASMMLTVFAPIAFILFFFLQEFFTETTAGKLIFGYKICQEEGENINLSCALLRSIARCFDYTPFGLLCVLISMRKQRPGDLAAGTLVCKMRRELKGIIALVLTVLFAISTLHAGLGNRNNLLRTSSKVNFLPTIDILPGKAKRVEVDQNYYLMIRDFEFAAGNAKSTRRSGIFKPGEEIFLNFKVDGYAMKDSKVWLQEDLQVRYPDGSVGLKMENVLEYHETLEVKEPVELTNKVILPENATAGRYTVMITLKDKNADKQLKEQRFFFVSLLKEDEKRTLEEGKKKEALQPEPVPVPEPSTPPAGPRTIIPQEGQ